MHAIAHTLGGLYGVPHGLANAVLLPLVLEDYGKAAYPRLARLAALVGLKGESEESLAKAFIAEIRAMNTRMGIPDRFNCIRSWPPGPRRRQTPSTPCRSSTTKRALRASSSVHTTANNLVSILAILPRRHLV